MNQPQSVFNKAFEHLTFKAQEPLAPFTSVKIGGPAELMVDIHSESDLIGVIDLATKMNLETTLLGWGANTLIADRGVNGIVIRYLNREIKISDELILEKNQSNTISPRFDHENILENSSDSKSFGQLDYDESHLPQTTVFAAAGVALPYLINHTISNGLTGLQWFGRIPATLGGAIFNNIHGGSHFLSEFIDSVSAYSKQSKKIISYQNHQLKFGYDYSIFHEVDEVILSAKLRLYRGDQTKALSTLKAWANLKASQPPISLGCVFQNLTLDQQLQLKLPSSSTGYLIDQVLGLKGKRIGNAQISLNHAAFIENLGGATASDYLSLIRLIYESTLSQLGVKLVCEIFFKGFKPNEIEGLVNNSSNK